MPGHPESLAELEAEREHPVVVVDHHGLILSVNRAFELRFGWRAEELEHEPLTRIIPPRLRTEHQHGFDRFLATERSMLLGRPLTLGILTRAGREVQAEHLILGERRAGHWRFAARIRRLEP